MKNLKMKTKIIIAFVIPVLFLILTVAMAVSSMGKINRAVVNMNDEQMELVQQKMIDIGADEKKANIIVETLEEAMVDDMKGIDRTVELAELANIIFVVAAILIVVVLSLMLTKMIVKSVAQLSFAAKEIAKGKIDIEMVKYNNDEFGELVDEYTHVIENIKNQAKIAEEVSNGNLTVQVMPSSNEDVMGNSLKKLVDQNFNALSNISDATFQVTTSASEVASASEALAQGSTQQASAIEEITASIDDIAEKTKQNATEATTATELVDSAVADVKRGNEQMQRMLVAMEDINKASESISNIIESIHDIAFQTNILALNAAVEAARAGEAGKGFAVVAEEVRNLAAKSADAAAETAELIEDSIQKVNAGSQIAGDTATAMEKIAETVKKSNTIIKGIADASNYQATAIEQVDQAVEQVSQVVQNNSATSEECAAASVELSGQANRMRELLSVYNLGKGSNSGVDTSMNYQSKTERNEQIISLGDDFGKY